MALYRATAHHPQFGAMHLAHCFGCCGEQTIPISRIFTHWLMSAHNQILIPDSFMALFLTPGRIKPNASHSEVAERYELCEDMANLLTETAQNMLFTLGVTELDVLGKCWDGLLVEPTVVSRAEAIWVVHRLAELLDWPRLDIPPDTDVASDAFPEAAE